MILDLHTLHFTSSASRCAYMVVFLVMAISSWRQFYLWHWMGAMGTSMTGSLILMGVRPDELPPMPIAMIVYWMYGASLVLAWTGLRVFFGRPVKIWLGIGLSVLPSVVYVVLFGLGLPIRLVLAAVFFCCLVPTILSLSETIRISSERLWAQYIEVLAFSSYAIVFAISIGILIGTDMPIASAESARISMILDQVMGVFIYFGFVAMDAERANHTILRLAETDILTNLINRRGLQTMLHRRFRQTGAVPTGGLLILDIDHFKNINDSYGHQGGDQVLIDFAVRIKSVLRPTDIVARWGGEEFLVMLPFIETNELLRVAERLREGIAEAPFSIPNGLLAVTVSIGCTMVGREDGGFEDGTRRADAALYRAKAQGRNRICQAAGNHDTARE